MTRVVIEPYSERWPAEFARLGRRLRASLGDRALRIDHIGSTAVPGLDAKDRIDVQVVVADLADANSLGGAGFGEVPVSDHRPSGGDAGADAWRKRLFQSPPEVDYLRTHPAAAAAYADLKRRLAAEVRGSAAYTDVKDALATS